MEQSDRAARMHVLIDAALAAPEIVIHDRSALHAGHAGSSGAGQTHYDVEIVSDSFAGMSRVARSRLVHAALQPEFERGLHALALTLRTAAERGTP